MSIHTARPLRVVIVGGGPSGLLMAYKLRRNFIDISWVIYEKNVEIGGTWYENRYPGCRCDSPAHTYVWSFDQFPYFSETYSTCHEIHDYFKAFHEKHELVTHTQTSCKVIGATWSSRQGLWQIQIRNNNTKQNLEDYCHVLINAGGFLNAPAWPNIPGISDFGGQFIHTAAWPRNFDIIGKHVGLIGNGSSGVQVAPAIVHDVSKLTMFIRNPAWVASMGSSYRAYTEAEQRRFEEKPENLTMLRKWLEHTANRAFPIFLTESDAQKRSRAELRRFMESALGGHSEAERLVQDWPVGCKRVSPGHGYIESLLNPKSRLVIGEISRITQKGILSKGEEFEFDAIICATGFKADFKPSFNIVANGRSLNQEWEKEPCCYFGMAAAGFPNYFMLLGPNSPLGNGPVLVGIEAQADYICKLMNRLQCENINTMTVKEEAVDDFIHYKDRFMHRTVWTEDCHSWYKQDATGKVISLWPGDTLHYIEALQEVRYEDFEIAYNGNRFEYFGDGLSRLEHHSDADLAPYIRHKDDGPFLGSRYDYAKKPPGFE